MTDSTTPAADNDTDLDDATSATLDTLEDVLDAVRERHPNTPQWEFCEGVLTALLRTRRAIGEDEWLPFIFSRDRRRRIRQRRRAHAVQHGLAGARSAAARGAECRGRFAGGRARPQPRRDGLARPAGQPARSRPRRSRCGSGRRAASRWRRCGPAAFWPPSTIGPTTGRRRATRKSPR